MSPPTSESTEPSPIAPEPQGGDARRFTRRSLFGASTSAAAAAIVSRPTLAQEGDNLPNCDGFVSAYPSPGATPKP
jgi:hypothetical protein